MKPANFILDLLRTYGDKGTSARNLMAAASLFSFGDNVMRVTLSRLTGRGMIEKVSRGHYRLAPGSDPIKDFVEEWRLGEQRIRDWSENYLTVYTEVPSDRQTWVLVATGFRQMGQHLWARPDNLRRQGESLYQWLIQLGVSDTAVLLENAFLDMRSVEKLAVQYDKTVMQKQYQSLNEQLKKSAARLDKLPKKQAMIESFSLGGKALQLLAKDPYLPEEMMPNGERLRLWQNMIDYDELGRNAWSGKPGSLPSESLRYAG